jgi:hypothetical protein
MCLAVQSSALPRGNLQRGLRGSGYLVVEASATEGQLSGYIQPLLRDVEVFNWAQDVTAEDKGFFRSIWEARGGGGETLLKNQRKNQFATRVELSASVHQHAISALQAFMAILRNACIEAFNPRVENSPDTGKSAEQ